MQAGVDRPPLDPYGATNPAEFFAVATEVFFDVPTQLEAHEPDLFGVLRDYYGQDPAERLRRAGASYEWVISQGLVPIGTTASGGGIGPPGSPGVHVSGATSSAGRRQHRRLEERRAAAQVRASRAGCRRWRRGR